MMDKTSVTGESMYHALLVRKVILSSLFIAISHCVQNEHCLTFSMAFRLVTGTGIAQNGRHKLLLLHIKTFKSRMQVEVGKKWMRLWL